MAWRRVVAHVGVCGLLLVLAICPLSLVVSSQTASSPQTTFTSDSELVLVPVELLDDTGHFLQGLTPADFQLESDGKPQRIAVFEEVHRPTQIYLPGPAAQPPKTLPAAFSNLPADGMPHDLTIVVIDRLNTRVDLQEWTRKQLLQYFESHLLLQPTALVAMTPAGLLEFQGPTWDKAALLSALNKLQPADRRFTPELNMGLRAWLHGRPGDYAIAMANTALAQEQLLNESLGAIGQSLRCFEQIARAYSAIPGRKTVLWFTSGFPALEEEPEALPPLFGHPGPPSLRAVIGLRHMGRKLAPEFREAIAEMTHANVVLYPIDVSKFPEDQLWGVWGSLWGSGHRGVSGVSASLLDSNSDACAPTFGFMTGECTYADTGSMGEQILAKSTGAEPCDAGNHVQHCFESAQDEGRNYYILGFYVPRDARNAGWHDLKVRVGRKHALLRARSGYYLDSPRPAAPLLETHAIDDAIVAPVEYTGIAFTVEPGRWKPGPGTTVPYQISVPASSVASRPGEDKLSFDVVSVPISNHGTPIAGAARISRIDMNHAGMGKALAHGWKLIDRASAPAAAVAVKVVVRDNVSGQIGSVVFPLSEDLQERNWRAPKQGVTLLLGDSAIAGTGQLTK